MKILLSNYKNFVCDDDGKIPWYQKDSPDLELFKKITMSGKACVIMGYNTFKTLKKPLAGRTNFVIDTKRSYTETEFGIIDDVYTNLIYIKGGCYHKDYCLIGGPKIVIGYLEGVNDPLKSNNFHGYTYIETKYTYIQNSHLLKLNNENNILDIKQYFNNSETYSEHEFENKTLGKCQFEVIYHTQL